MAHLFEPLKIKSVNFKNRIAVSPVMQYASKDGFSDDWHLVHLGSRAVGGASLVFTEQTAISEEGRMTYSDLGIWKGAHVANLIKITEFIKSQNAIPGIQLGHSGAKGSRNEPWKGDNFIDESEGGWSPLVSASNIAPQEGLPEPHPLTRAELKEIIYEYKRAAERAVEAGFEVLEIHAANGLLIHQFLSPLTNKRKDEYGGSFENRTRFLKEVLNAIKEVWPDDKPIFVKLSVTDLVEDEKSWTMKDSIKLAGVLNSMGIDVLTCSAGGFVNPEEEKKGSGYHVSYAEKIKNNSYIRTGAEGMITSARQADQIIRNDQADMVFMAREMIRQPYFALNAAKELNVDVEWPKQYQKAIA